MYIYIVSYFLHLGKKIVQKFGSVFFIYFMFSIGAFI